MAPSTASSGQSKGELEPTPQLTMAFNAIKRLVSENVLLAFPDPNVLHDICTDASDLQLGAVIEQEGNTVAFFSCKLLKAQLKCPTIDEEVLCIAEALKECRSIPWGAKVDIHTDHIDLTRNTITSNRIVTWRMLCKEFNPIFHCIKGPNNVEADALS